MENSYSHVLDRHHSLYFISLYIFQNYLAESKIQVEVGKLTSRWYMQLPSMDVGELLMRKVALPCLTSISLDKP
jgi:hypothetical protein